MRKTRGPLQRPARLPDGMVAGTALVNNAAAAGRYARALQDLTETMTATVKREIIREMRGDVAEEFFAQDAAPSITSRMSATLRRLRARFEGLFADKAKTLAESMADNVTKISTNAISGSMSSLGEAFTLPVPEVTGKLAAIYDAAVVENVNLIKSIPSQYLTHIEGAVMRSITTGNGLQDLVPAIEKQNGEQARRAKNIALDQTRKTYNSINSQRMQDMGVEAFQWIHSGGGAKPRPLHVGYNGRTFRFDDLPVIDEKSGEKGIPGQAVNCGCTMKPVFLFKD